MNLLTVIALLALPFLFALFAGSVLLKRAFKRDKVLPEEVALAAAWIFMVGSLVWLGVFLKDTTLLGFGTPWTWITAAHFAFAGYGALTITALCCRIVVNATALKILRILLIVHPTAYLITAGGILGFRYCDEIGATLYALIFWAQLFSVLLGQPIRIARPPFRLLVVALCVPLVTMIPALAWAWGQPFFDLWGMVRYHGLVNAIGYVGLALGVFLWARPSSHSAIRKSNPLPRSATD